MAISVNNQATVTDLAIEVGVNYASYRMYEARYCESEVGNIAIALTTNIALRKASEVVLGTQGVFNVW